jgi:ornithine cyclodeaminase
MILIPEAQAEKLMTRELAFSAVKRAFIASAEGSGTVNPVVIGQGLASGETYSIKSGAASIDRIVGLKVGSYWPTADSFGMARHGSSILLLDPDTGRLKALIEASRLNGVRTAAADAVAASCLSRADSQVLAVIGAGAQACHEIAAICAIRPIRCVLIATRTVSKANKLADLTTAVCRVPAEVVGVEEACRRADILVTVTSSRLPLFEAAWVRSGTHIASMGSDQVGKQELPTGLLLDARLFCDLESQSLKIGEFQHLAGQVESGSTFVTAIGDVLLGRKPGRQTRDEITVFDSSGLALQDLFVASQLLKAAHAERN